MQHSKETMPTIEPIESNLYGTHQLAWVINHFFGNQPTAVRDFAPYLRPTMARNIRYWINRAAAFDEIEPVDVSSPRMMMRTYRANTTALRKIEQDLKTVHYGEIPWKDKIRAFTMYIKHRGHVIAGNY